MKYKKTLYDEDVFFFFSSTYTYCTLLLHRSCLPCNYLEIWLRVYYGALFVGELAWRARKKATVSGKAKSVVQKSRFCSPSTRHSSFTFDTYKWPQACCMVHTRYLSSQIKCFDEDLPQSYKYLPPLLWSHIKLSTQVNWIKFQCIQSQGTLNV